MVYEMETEQVKETDVEVLSSMWPEDINEGGKQFTIEKPGADQDLEEVMINEETTVVDFMRLSELTSYSERGSSQLAYLVKNWEYKQKNAVRLLREELENLSKQQKESQLKKLKILEEHRFEEERYGGDKRPISILDENLDYLFQDVPRRRKDHNLDNKWIEIDCQTDSVIYWKQRAMHLEKLLEAGVQREIMLLEKLNESIECLRRQASPVEELSQVLKRADNFLHFILQNAPVVIGHQDKDLRYRFIYNHFPSLSEEEIIGKTDLEIFHGAGVIESHDFKKEVLERGLPSKREITFETELFGSKTFLIYVEPVFSKSGETIGVNYMGMEVTDQVRKREKMAQLREEIAVQKAKETELNKTIHITEETMRAKQMLATMSHEIRSPLSGVVSMTEILANTNLDKEQMQLVKVMLSSGDLVLQLINDILDLSKVESGVMKLEATKFRPREVVKHVLQTSAASLQKILTLEGRIAEDVPLEVVGDVLRIRQILTNLISNAIKFTHEGKVGIRLYVLNEPQAEDRQKIDLNHSSDQPGACENVCDGKRCSSMTQTSCNRRGYGEQNSSKGSQQNHTDRDNPRNQTGNATTNLEEDNVNCTAQQSTVWLRCDVYDTGIGIPEKALPSLFKKYMQAGSDTARKYGGTGLGLAICKQLVELMGGHLTVTSKEHFGSTFTFILPYKVSPVDDASDDPQELVDMDERDVPSDATDDDAKFGFFQFQPRTLGSFFSSHSSSRVKNSSVSNGSYNLAHKSIRTQDGDFLRSSDGCMLEKSKSDGSILVVTNEASSELQTIPNHKRSRDDEHKQQDNSDYDQFSVVGSHCPNASRTSKDQSTSSDATVAEQTSPMPGFSGRSSECSTSYCQKISESILKPKILLVEDNKVNVMVTQSMMKQFGHKVEVVSNGVEAVRAVQRSSYDLILMDVCMPVMDGLQATRIIRSFEESGRWDAAAEAGIEPDLSALDSSATYQLITPPIKRMPIIAMTANALSESAEQCFANGMDSYVSKPVTFQKLKQCLQQYLALE